MAPFLTSPSALATALGGRDGDGADGALSSWAVSVVSGLVAGYCPGLQLVPVSDATAVFCGALSRRLPLGVRPLTAVASVSVDGDPLGADAFSFRRSGVFVRRDGLGWGGVDAEVEVTFSAGFATIPPDLVAVVEAAAARLMVNPGQWRQLPEDGERATGGGDGSAAEGRGQLVAAQPTGFTVAELAVLNRFRRRSA